MEELGPSLCHPLAQKSQVSAVTFDLWMPTFANGLQFMAFSKGVGWEQVFQSAMG